MKKSTKYWKERFVQLEESQHKKAQSILKDFENAYVQAQKTLDAQIATWYQRFADNNQISLADAKKYLTAAELKEFKWDVKEYIKYGEENAINEKWMKELENASAKFHISRLEALKLQTKNTLETLCNTNLGDMTEGLKDIYESGYYHSIFNIQQGFGIGFDVSALDKSRVDKVIKKPWAVDGKNFSTRIWGNKDKLVNTIHQELTQNIMLGKDPQKAIDSIAKKMNTSKNTAGRLVMTEEAYFSSLSQKDAFNDLDVEEYEIVATLDSHTSEICQDLDGEVFKMADYSSGETAPPFHVYCRSTTAPHFDDDFDLVGKRVARDEDGQIYEVPADMTYHKWKDSFVDGGSKSEVTVKGQDAKIKATQTIFDALSRAYESNRIDNGLTSVPLGQIDDATNIIKVDVSKLSDESATSFSQTLKELVSEYNTPLTEFRTMNKMEALGNRNSFAFVSHNYEVDNAEMVLNPVKTKDFESHVNRIRELSEKGWCAKIKPENAEKYVVTHEFGHTILNIEQPLQNNRNWVNVDYKKIKKVRSEIQDVYSKYMTKLEDLTNDMKANELKFIMGTATDDEIEAARRLSDEINKVKISKYSMANVDEFLAESFANERLGVESNPYAKEVVDILDRYFKKKG